MLIEGHELTPTLKAIQQQHTDGVDPTVQIGIIRSQTIKSDSRQILYTAVNEVLVYQ